MADEVRKVPEQIASQVCGQFSGVMAVTRKVSGCGADGHDVQETSGSDGR